MSQRTAHELTTAALGVCGPSVRGRHRDEVAEDTGSEAPGPQSLCAKRGDAASRGPEGNSPARVRAVALRTVTHVGSGSPGTPTQRPLRPGRAEMRKGKGETCMKPGLPGPGRTVRETLRGGRRHGHQWSRPGLRVSRVRGAWTGARLTCPDPQRGREKGRKDKATRSGSPWGAQGQVGQVAGAGFQPGHRRPFPSSSRFLASRGEARGGARQEK